MNNQFPPHFSYEEMIFSITAKRKGIDNAPPKSVIPALRFTAWNMELVRQLLGDRSCATSSGYRSAKLNRAINGSKKSQHMKGEAIDFVCWGFGSPKDVCIAIRDSSLSFDQMIWEGSWVHISFNMRASRRNVLTAVFKKNKLVKYIKGIA